MREFFPEKFLNSVDWKILRMNRIPDSVYWRSANSNPDSPEFKWNHYLRKWKSHVSDTRD